MGRVDDATKRQRMEAVWALVRRHRLGILESEIAQTLNLPRRTVNNYLRALETEGRLYKDGRYWCPLDWDETRLRPVELSPEEALSLYLGARLLSKQMDRRHAATESALLKLANALRNDAGLGDAIVQAVGVLVSRPEDAHRRSVFREVVRGYIYRHKVRLRYKPLNWNRPFETTFATYLIEPSLIGSSLYLIGHSSRPNALRAYKLDRIQEATLTKETYHIPTDFDGLQALHRAWNIMLGEEQVKVVLRFSPRVRERVLETIWHPSQQVGEDPEREGWLRWEAYITHILDILPWVRSWGADVEALEPKQLRRALRRETRHLVDLYLGATEPPSPMYALWGKTDASTGDYHLLLYHLIDVGECALALWDKALTPAARAEIAHALGLSEEQARRFFGFWAAVHDLGKASPAYQCKYPPTRKALARQQALGFGFPERVCAAPVPHGVISAWALRRLGHEVLGLATYDAKRLAHAVGGHHGIWPATPRVQALDDKSGSQRGDGLWEEVRRQIFQTLVEVYQPPRGVRLPDAPEQNKVLTILSGLTTVADWLGSMDEFFDYEDRPLPVEKYRAVAAREAANALKATGWEHIWQPKGELKPFEQMFDFPPNAMQQKVIEAAVQVAHPAMLILEAPTGQGKTEAAFFIADTWLQQRGGRGMYIAMPTQATSNQMFTRTVDFLRRRYPQEFINVHLVHGQALWHESMEKLRLAALGDASEDRLRAETWFLPRKRTLLAPFGVGTVDQALMGVLQTRHAFLRLFGLAHKAVVFDEVHAYDTYMAQLFFRLLAWLRAVGASVIVLSATLPEKTRREMIAAFGQPAAAVISAEYPRLTLVTPEGVSVQPLPAPEERRLALEWIDRSPQAVAEALQARLAEGGCAAVVCNTVGRAQEVYRALLEKFPAEELTLFHARMPFVWRKEVEKKVLDTFGKGKERPQRAVVVATQVIEQSLDLDFDLMVSDLAPIDLLIQRAGRLHRHERRHRPPALARPRLLLTLPDGDISKPAFGSDAFVYARYALWQTWRVLEGRDEIVLPSETDDLINAVYGEFRPETLPPALRAGLKKDYEDMLATFRKEEYLADVNLLPEPSTEKLVTHPSQDLRDDDDPARHAQARARTRLIDPGVQIVCLHRQHDGSLNLEPDGSGVVVSLDVEPSGKEVKEILQYLLTIHDYRLVRLLATETPPWRRQASLRYVFPLVFEDSVCRRFQSEGLLLTLDRTLGFRIQKAEKEEV